MEVQILNLLKKGIENKRRKRKRKKNKNYKMRLQYQILIDFFVYYKKLNNVYKSFTGHRNKSTIFPSRFLLLTLKFAGFIFSTIS